MVLTIRKKEISANFNVNNCCKNELISWKLYFQIEDSCKNKKQKKERFNKSDSFE